MLNDRQWWMNRQWKTRMGMTDNGELQALRFEIGLTK